MDFTYISNNKTDGKDIRYNIPGHFSFATYYTVIYGIYLQYHFMTLMMVLTLLWL